MNEPSIRLLLPSDIEPMAAAFKAIGWNKPVSQYQAYMAEQEAGQRVVLVANMQSVFAGYLTICWQSHYPPFLEAHIPEIVDFNVLPTFRRRGIGSRLMDTAEAGIAIVSPQVGIGVGMSADYGAAQRMYARRGYLPDARGLMVKHQPVTYGLDVRVDDDLCLYFTKEMARPELREHG